MLRQALNKIASSLPLDKCRLLKQIVAEDVMIYACLSLRFDASMIGTYFHGKVCDFVYRKASLILIASFTCQKRKLALLARSLSRQFLSSAVVNNCVSLDSAMLEPYIFDTSKTVTDVVTAFNTANGCKVSIQRSFVVG